MTGDAVTVAEMRESYDWPHAFEVAKPSKSLDDVAQVLGCVCGANDSDHWVGVFLMKDGSFGYLNSWCDYTGWDCQAGGVFEARPSLAALIREVLTDDDRQRLGAVLPEDVARSRAP